MSAPAPFLSPLETLDSRVPKARVIALVLFQARVARNVTAQPTEVTNGYRF